MADDLDSFDIFTDEPLRDDPVLDPPAKPPIGNGADKAPRRPRFKLVPFNELTVGSRAVYLVKGIIPKAGLVVVWGPPKCGKSYWIFTVTLHVALGREYRGRRVQQGMVVYLALEGQDGFDARAAAFRSRYLDGTGDVPDFFLVKERTDLVRDHQALIQCIGTQCEGAPAAVVIDTLNRSLVGSESDDKDMGAYMRAADAIREKFNCAVVIVHHCGVDGSRPRGHTSLTGAADMQISVKRDAAKNIVATVEYAKDGPEGAVIASKLEPVDLGRDEDGDLVTACVVMPVEDGTATAAKTPPARKETKVMRTFRDAFIEALNTDGNTLQVRGGGPKVRAVDVQKVRAEFERRYATGEADPKKRAEASRKAFKRTMAELPPQFATETREGRELIWKVD